MAANPERCSIKLEQWHSVGTIPPPRVHGQCLETFRLSQPGGEKVGEVRGGCWHPEGEAAQHAALPIGPRHKGSSGPNAKRAEVEKPGTGAGGS